MKKSKTRILLFGVTVLLLMSACLFNVTRNDDGTLRVETTLSADLIRTTLLAAANLPESTEVQIDLMDGYVQVHADQLKVNDQMVNDITFNLELTAADGKMQARIFNASYSGTPIPDEDLANYNEQIAQNLESAGAGVDNASLDSVQVTPDGVIMVWRVDASGN